MTTRQTHQLAQGTPDWHAFRSSHFGASEAAAMLGLSPYATRGDLLRQKATGLADDVNPALQRIYDRGHATEALARPLMEARMGEDLYPAVYSLGRLSASLDGITLDEHTAWEHKQYNADLYASLLAGELPEHHMAQCQQIMLVSGASQVLFTCSDGTEDRMAVLAVDSDGDWFGRLEQGWAQFEKDLADWQPSTDGEAQTASPIKQLPALAVQIRGEVTLSNLPEFQAAAERFIAAINTDLQTDDDFSQAEETVKFCQTAENNIDLAKRAALAQTATIDDLMRTLDLLREQLRAKRLHLEKLVKTEKDNRRAAIILEAKSAFSRHVMVLQKELEGIVLPSQSPDFAAAIKGKRTLSSIRDAVDTTLANAKIDADATAQDWREKLAWFAGQAAQHRLLFADLQALVFKPLDDFKLAVESRIEQHVKAEQVKIAAQIEAERQRIRQEEQAKAQQAAEAEARRIRLEEQEKAAAERERLRQEGQAKAQQAAEAEARRIRLEEQEKAAAERERLRQEGQANDQAINQELAGQAEALKREAAQADAAVVGHQDEIAEFFKLKQADGDTVKKIRPWLVEFVKFQQSRPGSAL